VSTSIKALLLVAILMIGVNVLGQVNIVNFDFGAVLVQCSNGYAYQGAVTSCPYGYNTQDFDEDPGFGWILGAVVARQLAPTSLEGGSGLTGPNTIFYPPSFTGMPFNQAVFLQDRGGFVWQAVNFAAGSYTLSFYLGSRCGYDGNQTVEALIDGQVVGTWALSSCTPFALQTSVFTVSNGGSHTVEFLGMNAGDHTAFLSYVTITPRGR
jgi:hypothetical protein